MWPIGLHAQLLVVLDLVVLILMVHGLSVTVTNAEKIK